MRQYFSTFLILILSFLGLISCESSAYISGQLEGTEGEEFLVYLIQPKDLSELGASYFGLVIDSAVVRADGRFELANRPHIELPELFELVVQKRGKAPNYLEVDNALASNYMPIVWSSGETIQLSADVRAFQKSLSIQNPSALNNELLRLRNVSQQALERYLRNDDNAQEEIGLLELEHAKLQYQRALMDLADETNYFLSAMVALRWVSPQGIYERVPEFLVEQCARWQDEQHAWSKELCELASPTALPVLIGDEFPNERLPMIDMDTLAIYDIMGEQLTIIDLWASWCAPCRKENRKVLAPLWDAYHEKGFQIIGYGLESDRNAWIGAIAKDEADRWYHASELEGDDAPFLRRLRIQTIPANFILDTQGKVIAKNLHGEELVEFVKHYLD